MARTTCPESRSWLPWLCALLCVAFAALGLWQVQRLHWKQTLIERVQTNLGAQPLRVDAASALTGLDLVSGEYRPVQVQGKADCQRATPVWAATSLGTGYWWMLPVRLSDGQWLWVNTGYVAAGFVKSQMDAGQGGVSAAATGCGRVNFTGLLRRSQTGGGFLRPNQPETGRWYSRDIAALSSARGLNPVVTVWFVDAQTDGLDEPVVADQVDATRAPVPGLTPLQWPNKHLGYALTWFSLSLMALAGVVASSVRLRRFVFKFRFQP